MIHASWKAYFLFSQKEIKGIIVLGCILFGSVILSWLLPHKASPNRLSQKNTFKGSLFYFDPNTIDSNKALQLGLNEKQVKSLLHYRAKGGYFKNQDDFSRLYGLSPEMFSLLRPYVLVKQKQSKVYGWGKRSPYKLNYVMDKEDWRIEINQANEQTWAQKTHLSNLTIQRILAYKQYLGAFTKVNQVAKVYGLSDAEFQSIKRHLYIDKSNHLLVNANALTFTDWQQMGLFTDKQIWLILRLKKEQGGRLGWREIAENCDLTEGEVQRLKTLVHLDD